MKINIFCNKFTSFSDDVFFIVQSWYKSSIIDMEKHGDMNIK